MEHLELMTSPRNAICALFFTAAAVFAQPQPLPEELTLYKAAEPFQALLDVDIRKLEPDAVLIPASDHIRLSQGHGVRKSATRGKNTVYLEILADWIEPVPAPAAPGGLQVVLAQGQVEAAPPGQPQAFTPVAAGAVLVPGSILRTGPDSQAGISLGRRSTARFIAGTTAEIGYQAPASEGAPETVRLNLKSGAVFNRIKSFNKDVDYQVQTPHAVVAARGTDFVAVALPTVTDVWIAEGTVEMMDLQGNSIGTVSADEPGALKIIRNPPAPDAAADAAANTLTMSVAMSLIPQVNTTAAANRAAERPTPEQLEQLQEVRRVSYYIKAATAP